MPQIGLATRIEHELAEGPPLAGVDGVLGILDRDAHPPRLVIAVGGDRQHDPVAGAARELGGGARDVLRVQMLERLEAILPVRLEKLRNVIATPTKQVYTVKEVVTDARGMPVYDLVPPHKANYRGEKKARTEVVPVKYGHELYDEKYAKHVKTLKAELAATINAIPFYAAAVRVWKKGLDEMEPILRGIRETDKPALPLELRNNPRRRTAVAHLPARRKVTR